MDLLQSLLNLIDYKVELALWIGFSMGLYALGADIAWHYRRPRPGRLGRWAAAAVNGCTDQEAQGLEIHIPK